MRIKLTRQELEEIEKNRWLTDRERKVFDLYYRRGWTIEAVAADSSSDRSRGDNLSVNC